MTRRGPSTTLAFPGGPLARRSDRFVLLGDLQRTSWLELWRERNDAERHAIVAAVADERPDFVVLLGDLVFRGDSPAQWLAFDELTAPLRAMGTPVLSLLGNHDHGCRATKAREQFASRFPHHAGHGWSVHRYGPLSLVRLDSNRGRMSAAAWDEQVAWLSSTLAEADDDENVSGVLVLAHHPPFTNSRVSGDDEHVQNHVVPSLLRARKTLALISGHVHAYERFEREGKTFVVSGGGGGPRVPLHEGDRRRHPDDLFSGPSPRPFHYLRAALSPTGLSLEVRGFGKGERVPARIDAFDLPFPSR